MDKDLESPDFHSYCIDLCEDSTGTLLDKLLT